MTFAIEYVRINASAGDKTHIDTIFFISFTLTVLTPFNSPTPTMPPMRQYVVDTGMPRTVKRNTVRPAELWAENPERGSRVVMFFPRSQ